MSPEPSPSGTPSPPTRPAPPAHVDEELLLERARAGSTDAFEALVRRSRNRLYAVALRLTADPQTAEDVTQEAYLKAWTRLQGFRGGATFQTWMYRILVNQVHDLRRNAAQTRPLPHPDVAVAARTPGADQSVIDTHRRQATADAIASLPFPYRAPLVLHYFAACTYREVGRILGISETAAKVRVHRARRLLSDQLDAWR